MSVRWTRSLSTKSGGLCSAKTPCTSIQTIELHAQRMRCLHYQVLGTPCVACNRPPKLLQDCLNIATAPVTPCAGGCGVGVAGQRTKFLEMHPHSSSTNPRTPSTPTCTSRSLLAMPGSALEKALGLCFGVCDDHPILEVRARHRRYKGGSLENKGVALVRACSVCILKRLCC